MIEIFRKSWEVNLLKWREQLIIQRRWYLIKSLMGEQQVRGGKGHCNQRNSYEQRHRSMKGPEDSAIKGSRSGHITRAWCVLGRVMESKARTFGQEGSN